jgi:hypothetical protein
MVGRVQVKSPVAVRINDAYVEQPIAALQWKLPLDEGAIAGSKLTYREDGCGKCGQGDND